MKSRLSGVVFLIALFSGWAAQPVWAAEENPAVAAVQAAGAAFVKAFESGDVDGVAALFAARGELVDEGGNIYQEEALRKLFTQYFAKYPGAKLKLEPESIRVIGGVAIEQGVRELSTKEDAKARVKYLTVWAKTDDKWQIASTRETFEELDPTPGERLAAIDWLVGDWVCEDADAAMKISYRWSDDKNFLLGEILASKGGETQMKSTQRIGWDPLAGNFRSWVFDSDGGFAEGSWTQSEDGWVIKSAAVSPDGTVGSATVTILPKGRNQFSMQGTDRVIGDERDEDFSVTVTRAPPATKKQTEKATPAPETKPPVAPKR